MVKKHTILFVQYYTVYTPKIKIILNNEWKRMYYMYSTLYQYAHQKKKRKIIEQWIETQSTLYRTYRTPKIKNINGWTMEKKTPYIHKKINKNKINIGKALTPIRYPKKKRIGMYFCMYRKKPMVHRRHHFGIQKQYFFSPKKLYD